MTVDSMWQEYRAATGVDAELAGSFAFGDSPGQADELGALVVHGPKRATAGLVLDYEHDGEPLPTVGEYSVVLGGAGEALCVIRVTQVDVAPFHTVDESFAWDEGEGDRTLAYWRRAHENFFRRRCAHLDIPYSEDLEVSFERFQVVWPAAAR